MSDDEHHRLIAIQLDEKTFVRRRPEVEHERAIAIFDLLEGNFFRPLHAARGPYGLTIGIAENRLQFDIVDADGVHIPDVTLPVALLRNVVKDYFLICESYYAAIKRASPSHIEAIDMSRRALHNEGSETLRERLAEKIEMDLETARRLFTLICVLHIRG
jgi:uncharacterized protein (UPF0262 family)